MGELLAKYTEAGIIKEIPQSLKTTKALPDVPVAEISRPTHSVPRETPSSAANHSISAHPSPTKGTKRRSSEIAILSDKENEPAVDSDLLCNPKNPKRNKTATTTGSRVASRTTKNNPGNVLSPKSHNSRTLPRSPIKDINLPLHPPSKPSYIARPTSPLKPASPLKTAASAATSAISASLHGMVEHAKRGAGNATAGLRRTASKDKAAAAAAANAKGKMAPPPRPTAAAATQQPERPASSVSNHSAASNSSLTSNATTVVTKKAAGRGKTTLSATTTTMRKATGPTTTTKASAVKSANGKAASAVAKKVVVAEPAAGRRVLRKRN
jgi:hypothetical protein